MPRSTEKLSDVLSAIPENFLPSVSLKAPESIVTLPGAALSDFDGFLQADRAGVRAERFAEGEQRPGRNASEQ